MKGRQLEANPFHKRLVFFVKIFIYKHVCMSVSMCVMCACRGSERPQDSIGSTGAGAPGSCEPLEVALVVKSSTLEEQFMFLTSELLQPHRRRSLMLKPSPCALLVRV